MNIREEKKKISLYIHMPFCKQKCLYCDFTSYTCKEQLMVDYIKALAKEISIVTDKKIIKTIFIGGGTPTYLSLEALNLLKESLDKVQKTEDVEFTVEGNPGTFTEEKLKVLKSTGVNRLSIGLQCFQNSMLKMLGRIHTVEEFEESFKMARKLGFNNINVDLMFGLPNQKLNQWRETLENVVKLSPEHLSCYSLIIEEGTPFYKMYEKDILSIPGEDEEREMYDYCINFLREKGFFQYEISNFAKPNNECKHNLVYWNLEEYLACGVSAHSYIDGKRVRNTNSIEEYIKSIEENILPQAEVHINTQKEEIEEFIFMGLRKSEGISMTKFRKRFKQDIFSIYKNSIEKYLKSNLLLIKGDNLYLSKEAISVSNTILCDFVLD